MLFGHVENFVDRVDHLARLRELRDRLRTRAAADGVNGSHMRVGPGERLGVGTVAALAPDDFNVTVCDEGVTPIDFESDAEFIGITGGKFSPKKIWLVSDMQWDDDVTVEGAMEDMEAFFRTGLEVANDDAWPNWKEGTEFKAKRDAQRP